ncbi:MAG: hypothetical protein ACRYG2_05680 [Janthinobacterium lividum]
MAGAQELDHQISDVFATRDLIGQAKGVLVERHTRHVADVVPARPEP